MANILYSGDEFPPAPVLVEQSLYETLYRLLEAHWGLRDPPERELASAVDWLGTRMATPTPRIAWRRTDYDRQRAGGYTRPSGETVYLTYLKLPTGEAAINFALTFADLFLSLIPADDADHQRIRDNLLDVYPDPLGRRPELLSQGVFCCPSCPTRYQLALSQISPGVYAQQEPRFIAALRASRVGRSRWVRRRHPRIDDGG